MGIVSLGDILVHPGFAVVLIHFMPRDPFFWIVTPYKKEYQDKNWDKKYHYA